LGTSAAHGKLANLGADPKQIATVHAVGCRWENGK
jgi:hypothetical protein